MDAIAASITIVTVNYNTVEHLQKCVGSVHRFYPNLTMRVVDNGSTDGSREYLHNMQGQFPGLRVDLQERNVFHGPGLHHAILKVETPYFFTLDSDAYFLRAGL